MIANILLGCAATMACGTHAPSDDLTVEQVVGLLKAATSAVETVEGRFVALSAGEGVVFDPFRGKDGLVLCNDFIWVFERATRRFYLSGRWGFLTPDKKEWQYQSQTVAYDGEKLRAINPNACLISELGRFPIERPTPLHIWGDVMTDTVRMRSVVEILSSGKTEFESDSGPGSFPLVKLRSTFDAGRDHDMILRVWVDASCGFLPRHIRLEDPVPDGFPPANFNGLVFEVINHKIEELSGNVWVITEGQSQSYYSDVIPPPGMSKEDLKLAGANPERARELAPRCQIVSVPTGPPAIFRLDVANTKINQKIDPSRFQLEFPPGMLVWDDFEKRSYQVPRSGPAPSAGTVRPVYIGTLIVVGLTMVGVAWYALRKTRSSRGG